MIVKIRLLEKFVIFFTALVFIGTILTSCKGDDVTGSQTFEIVDVIISPDSASFNAGEQMEFSALALTDAGDTVNVQDLDVEWEGEWWSTDPNIFTVEENGIATGENPGEAFCVVEVNFADKKNFTMRKDVFFAGSIPLIVSWLSPNSNMRLSAPNEVFKERLRFTGRDSAIVFVF